ncbi:MAG: M60 family metallopeptidase [Lentisphaeria bacterium]|nr:M60 family metallopeptidase [Lentisphaeria bacterium]
MVSTGWLTGIAVALCTVSRALAAGDAAGAHGADRRELLAGVEEIAAPGIPGPVCVVGPQAFCVVSCHSDGVPAAVVAAGTAGQGRVVAFGHNGYMNEKALATADTGRLVSNALRWSSRNPAPHVLVIQADAMAEFLLGQGFAVQRANVADAAARIADAQAVCIDSHAIGNQPLGDAIARHVEAGGGLVTFATGWGWVQLNPGKAINRDFAANAILARAGIAFSAAMSKRTSAQGFAATDDGGPYVQAGAALDALLGQADGTVTMSKEEMKQASTIITQAARAVHVDDTTFRPRIEALLDRQEAPIVPTRANPVRDSDGLARLVVALLTERLRQMPAAEITAHPAAKEFPGEVPADAARVRETISVDTSVPRWHSTGLYAAPGEAVTLVVPEPAAGKGLLLRIGAHRDGIWPRSEWWRYPEITRTFAVAGPRTVGACAFGGLVYLEVPDGCDLGVIEVAFEGAVPAPLYRRGQTDLREWRESIRLRPGPWAEIGSGKVILTVPAANVRDLDDPEELMAFWDGVLDACADLAVIGRERKSPERYVTDVQISVGYMHSGYPIMTFLDVAPRFVDVADLRGKGNWGMFHEMGHNHQSGDWTFGGTVEVTVNLFSLYVLEQCCPGAPVLGGALPENRIKRTRKHILEDKASFDAWKRDPFTGLVMYIQLREAFGWDAYKRVFAEYRSLPKDQKPADDDAKRDQWLMRFSRTVGRNLGPFFEAWGVPTSEEARRAVAELPVWMPDDFPPQQ